MTSGETVTEGNEHGTRLRILQAAYECVARWGFSKTTVEDAGRGARVSRATVYRYFPGGREELLSAVVAWENARFFARLYEEVREASTLEEVMELGLVFAHRDIRDHDVLQRVLDTEPELLLPKLTVEAEGTQRMIAAFLEPYLFRERLAPGVVVSEAADFLARMALSYISAPGRWDLADRGQVSRLVRGELLGGILLPASHG
ncbi:MAG: TetR/AcrR family transcriptional regulator [Actinomycetota bacterium]|nr:TetR/AcrR family transcriptional regulator [Actinomycetota bacterium]